MPVERQEVLSTKLIARPKAGGEYRKWISEYADCLGTFATLTLPRPASRDTAVYKGKRFGRRLNESIFNRHFQRRKQGLFSVFSVEGGLQMRGRIANPHLHYLVQSHPLVTTELIRDVWAEIAGRRAARIGIDVQHIPEEIPVDTAIGYILKYVDWEHGPEVYIPKSSLRAVGAE